MPAFTDLSQGTPYWVDLTTPDIEASMVFYSHIFGWRYEEAPPNEVGGKRYAWAQNQTGYPAGIAEQDSKDIETGIRPRWNVHVIVDDIDDVSRRVDDLGGVMVQAPAQVGDYGIGAVISDPTGGQVNIWQAITSGPTIKHEHGAMQWCELMSTDSETASEFYRTLLRVRTDSMEMPDGSINYIVNTQDGAVFSISALNGLSDDLIARAGGTMWVTYFNVYDVDTAVDRAIKQGAELPDPPWDVPGISRMAWIYDPQGALLGLITPPGA